MPKQKQCSSSFCASRAKRLKRILRQDPDKQQQENERQRDRRQLASARASRKLASETREHQEDRIQLRNTAARTLARQNPDTSREEQLRNTAARQQA